MFSREDAVRMHRELVLDGETWWGPEGDRHRFTADPDHRGPLHVPTVEVIRRELAGRDLMCWCPLREADGLPVPCHADTLIAIALGELG